jgi:hypothetical protein
MAIILKANKVNLFVFSVLFVFWYHSPKVLDTPHICNISRLRVNHNKLPTTPLASPFTNAILPYKQTNVVISNCFVNCAEGEQIFMTHLLSLHKIKVAVLSLTVPHVVRKLYFFY